MKYLSDIAIVGVGHVLPSSRTMDDFEKIIQEGNTLIEGLGNERWLKEGLYSTDRKEADRSYSKKAACVDDKVFSELKEKHAISRKAPLSRLELFTIEAMENLLKTNDINLIDKNVAMVLGIMNPDELFFTQGYINEKIKIIDYVKKNWKGDVNNKVAEIEKIFSDRSLNEEVFPEYIFSNSILGLLESKFNFKSESFLVDAACASSLASIDICCQKLSLGEVDIAIAGGLESNLSVGAFVLFSKVGALADEISYPFDAATNGLTQGEGVVLFALERLEDARENSRNILGVIKSCGASSDGKSGSLFQPTVKGQILAYDNCYRDIDSKRVDYIEGHGTGTLVGDQVEISSLSSYFQDFQIPLGSVKYIFGHTKGTAGATSLLKILSILKNKKIPASRYLKNQLVDSDNIRVNGKELDLKGGQYPIRCGISSLGFGGTNYHLLVEEFVEDDTSRLTEKLNGNRNEVFINYEKQFHFEESYINELNKYLKVPPHSISKIDKMQLFALNCVFNAFKEAKISYKMLDKKRVNVVSASTIGLGQLMMLGKRIMHVGLCLDVYDAGDCDFLKLLEDFRDLNYPEITEDSGPGILNNVIAGRICNVFDFNGKNYNIDDGINSPDAALKCIFNELLVSDELYILVGINEEFVNNEIERTGVQLSILSTREFSKEFGLPIVKKLEVVSYDK